MTSLPIIDAEVRAAAEHGAWCPKLCNHACPVLAATGRNEAVPWGFHRTVSDLAAGTLSPQAARDHLADCTGCLGCQVPCTFDQDVPRQVRAGRAAVAGAGAPLAALAPAQAAVDAGLSPFGVSTPTLPQPDADAQLTVVVGCRDDAAIVDGVARLYRAADTPVRFVAAGGCCGATLRDLGSPDDADRVGDDLRAGLDGPVVALDPHCLDELGADALHVLTSLDGLLGDGRLTFAPGDAGPVTYHDPCLLARAADPVIDAPRRLLAAAGYSLTEPEAHGAATSCSGAGLAYELVDPDAAGEVAARRREQVVDGTLATGCSGARRQLGVDRDAVHDIFSLLADRLPRTTP